MVASSVIRAVSPWNLRVQIGKANFHRIRIPLDFKAKTSIFQALHRRFHLSNLHFDLVSSGLIALPWKSQNPLIDFKGGMRWQLGEVLSYLLCKKLLQYIRFVSFSPIFHLLSCFTAMNNKLLNWELFSLWANSEFWMVVRENFEKMIRPMLSSDK